MATYDRLLYGLALSLEILWLAWTCVVTFLRRE